VDLSFPVAVFDRIEEKFLPQRHRGHGEGGRLKHEGTKTRSKRKDFFLTLNLGVLVVKTFFSTLIESTEN
jgi:hypothetical protein